MLEKDVEKKLRDMVVKHGGLCLKWVSPGASGVPDRLLCLPGGLIVFVETKRPKGGVVSELQRYWQQKLTRLGFWFAFIWSTEDVERLELLLMIELDKRRLR